MSTAPYAMRHNTTWRLNAEEPKRRAEDRESHEPARIHEMPQHDSGRDGGGLARFDVGMSGTTACPDFTNVAARKWLWNLFFSKALDPALKYPGDTISWPSPACAGEDRPTLAHDGCSA